ncbi:hypothetical protein HPB50_021361 [Hyalomma asiaticum]|uniref:Uncharacterized protein n=1 Tax=Hyalomma asiaticum TaxID=266040 RepID=A0ACB7SQ95_HYAAI|nr:hypothetical protein HPB50_021361 [Hyalomma asiaticum]
MACAGSLRSAVWMQGNKEAARVWSWRGKRAPWLGPTDAPANCTRARASLWEERRVSRVGIGGNTRRAFLSSCTHPPPLFFRTGGRAECPRCAIEPLPAPKLLLLLARPCAEPMVYEEEEVRTPATNAGISAQSVPRSSHPEAAEEHRHHNR